MTLAHPAAVPIPRDPDLDFTEVPAHWLADNVLLTHVVGGLTLVFPAGERFFIRSVKRFAGEADEALAARIRGFAAQEALHGREHERAFPDVSGFLRWYERVAYRRLEPLVTPRFRLAVTVALEHATATLGAFALTSDLLDDADPAMAALLRWHGAEEIEHKAVAFDLLQQIAPGYTRRVAGLVLGGLDLTFFWTTATLYLMWKDPAVTLRRLLRDTWRARRWWALPLRLAWRTTAGYLRPSFHPDDIDDRGLAAAYLASAGYPAG